MKVIIKKTKPFNNQKPGTSGLRQKTKIFLQENYLENYIQAIFNVLKIEGKSFVLGGDGRYYNEEALQIVIKMAISQGAKEIFVAQNGFISTPALSNYIRCHNLDFGIMLSASHNPGGITGDFGVKVNGKNGAPLADTITNQIYEETKNINEYQIVEIPKVDITKIHTFNSLNTTISVVDSIVDYVNKMKEIFDFKLIKSLLDKKDFKISFDAFNGITGPYAKAIFHECLGVDLKYLRNIEPKEDFGGILPDPNPITAKEFVDYVRSNPDISLGLACDGDGDRNMIFSQKHFIEPSDSLALMLEYAKNINYYANKLYGVARSKATSNAVDKVAKNLDLPCYQVPTGWKFFGNLLDAKKIIFCGEESFGAGSIHSREKDGLWALLYYLNIIALCDKPIDEILEELWQKYGRVYFSRNDFENISYDLADKILDNLNKNSKEYINKEIITGYKLNQTYNFSYIDITNNEKVENQGLVLEFEGAEIMIRKSGTGTSNATVRVYLSKYEKENIYEEKLEYLKDLQLVMLKLADAKVKPTFII